MRRLFQWPLSVLFIFQMYLMMALMALWFTPLTMIWRGQAYVAVMTYCRYVRWSARWLIGLRSEVRGEVPQDEVIIASKHQSFFDILMIVSVIPRPKFIMKKEILWTPIVGWYARRLGCIAVDRGKRGRAVTKMVADVKAGHAQPGQLVIFPQGTRVAAGVKKAYKIGTGALYTQLGQDCVPVATNVGVFWPRHSFYRKPGLAVIEFLPRIKAGAPIETFMEQLEQVVEVNSDRLSAEAGFVAQE